MAKKKRLQQVTPPPQRTMTKRQLTKYQREQQQIRRIVILLSAALAVCLLVLLVPIYINLVVNPNRTVATVEGQNINRATYDKQRRWDLYQQINQAAFYYQYSQQSGQASGDFSTSSQYADLVSQLNTVSDSPLDPTTLNGLVDNTLTVRHASDFNIQYNDQDVISNTVADQAPPPQPATATSEPISPTVTGTPPTATPVLTPTNTSTPLPTHTPGGPTDTPTQTPTITPTPTVTDTPIPVAGASATAVARYDTLIKEINGNKPDASTTYCRLSCPGLSKDDYLNLIAKPDYLKKQITTILQGQIATTTLQLKLSQIQSDTEEDANAAKAAIDQGKGFDAVAREKSTDTATKEKGGDMGWQAKGQQSAEFDASVFDVNPAIGKVLGPFKDDAGWHLVIVTDRNESMALTGDQLSSLKNKVFDNWLSALKKKAQTDGSISVVITATPTSEPLPTSPPPPTLPPAETPPMNLTPTVATTSPITSTGTLTGTAPVTSTNPLTNTGAANTPTAAAIVASPTLATAPATNTPVAVATEAATTVITTTAATATPLGYNKS